MFELYIKEQSKPIINFEYRYLYIALQLFLLYIISTTIIAHNI